MATATDVQIAAGKVPRTRVPASERRDALIDAAMHEFAHGGLHGTPVDRIARRVGVAQPYVFSLFGSKKELFLAAIARDFDLIAETFERAAESFDPAQLAPDEDVLRVMGRSYVELLHASRDYLLLQHQAYAACDDEEIRTRVRSLYARLVARVEEIARAAAVRCGESPPTDERIDEFFRYGMSLNVAAAMGVEDLSAGCDWVREELASRE